MTIEHYQDPAFQALYEVGAVNLDRSGDPVVEPNPASLLRGLVHLALPRNFPFGIVNATRASRGLADLTEKEFDDLDHYLFDSLRKGSKRCIGDHWFGALNRGSYLL